MAGDMAEELRPHGVAVVSLWPGAVQTEMFGGRMAELGKEDAPGNDISAVPAFLLAFFMVSSWVQAELAAAVAEGETVEYSGKCVVALATNAAKAFARSGRVLFSTDLGDDYGFVDVNGCQIRPGIPGDIPWSIWRPEAAQLSLTQDDAEVLRVGKAGGLGPGLHQSPLLGPRRGDAQVLSTTCPAVPACDSSRLDDSQMGHVD